MKSACRKKHIALFIPSMNSGGAERVVATLANEFVKNGNIVDLILVNANGPFLSKISSHVNIIDLKTKKVLRSIFGLIMYLRKYRPDILLSALGHANIIVTIANVLSKTNTPIILSEHSTLKATLNIKNWRGKIIPWLIKFTYPKASGIIAVSKGVANEIAEFTGIKKDKIEVIYNPIVSDELINLSNEPVDHEWFVEKNAPIILSAGRLERVKDIDTLLHAFSLVLKQIPSKLIILGDGSQREGLKLLSKELKIEKNVAFLGFQENPYKYMKNSNVYVVTSVYEALGNSLIEAIACGTSVVSTNCPYGPSEILEEGKWGVLVPIADPKSLSHAILNIILESKSIDASARSKDFSIEESASKYLAFFERFTKR